MENRSHALMAGFFTIALLVLAAVFALWLGKDKIKRTPYEIATKLSVAGLNMQAAVRYKGIRVGNVSNISFDPTTPGQILLHLDVMSDTPVTKSTYATLAYQGVTGIAFVQLDEDNIHADHAPLLASTQNDVIPRIPLRPGMMQNLEQRGVAILNQTEELTKRLNLLLDPNNRQSIATAVENIGKAAAAWQTVPEKLGPALDKLPALAEQTQSTLIAIKTLSGDASKLSNNINQFTVSMQAPDGPLARLNQSVEQISAGISQETLPKINAITNDARSSLRAINRTTDALNERPQSLLFGNAAPAPGPGEPGFVAPK
ncbi:MlaD family protein [Undibacterium sp. 5I1]|uniref:MlaD family protein n=2 Tax=unclassified Undibacterium TaxID=2630295 RepID=UPI002AB4F5A1|nr:MlaD family protein [Undibacterium sp. 5I1]MDY7539308.1 MlaD family protein [Undibacterium sp. 5I1]MEB0259525.1 MlaD family protein [Undibacterium sp. 5I1]